MESRLIVDYSKAPSTLNKLAKEHNTDKGSPQFGSMYNSKWNHHSYTDFYERQFGFARKYVKNVFECGIGTPNTSVPSSMHEGASPGASLRMWRDYFPNAQIVGADIDPDIMFSEDRIETVVVDQLIASQVEEMFSSLKRTFDIIIDDGLHTLEAAQSLFNVGHKYLEPEGLYIIEDIRNGQAPAYKSWADSTGVSYDIISFAPTINMTKLFVFRAI
jgi:trans-aconitate methyltransferase